MRVPGRFLSTILLILGVGVHVASATEPKTWYVYCEGNSSQGHWAVFSENFWPHPDSADYGRRVGSAAKAFFEARHDLSLEGCAGVNFRDDSLAEHSRRLTVRLHKRMGDRVYFFPLPRDALPDESPPVIAIAAEKAPATEAASLVERREAPRQWEPYTAPR